MRLALLSQIARRSRTAAIGPIVGPRRVESGVACQLSVALLSATKPPFATDLPASQLCRRLVIRRRPCCAGLEGVNGAKTQACCHPKCRRGGLLAAHGSR